nr:MAG TPA: hypothetical protein [Caudoviricetes sp.]
MRECRVLVFTNREKDERINIYSTIDCYCNSACSVIFCIS